MQSFFCSSLFRWMLRKNCLPGAASKAFEASRTQREAARQLSPFGSSCLGDAPIRNTEMPQIRSKPLALHLGLRIQASSFVVSAGIPCWCPLVRGPEIFVEGAGLARNRANELLRWNFRILQARPRIPRNLPAPLPRILQARRGQLSGN